jgi:hypothetical protein
VSAIKAGDLVMVVRASTCCNDSRYVGVTFRVTHLETDDASLCSLCGDAAYGITFALGSRGVAATGFNVLRLQRVAPLSDPEEAQTKVEREEKKRSPVNA